MCLDLEECGVCIHPMFETTLIYLLSVSYIQPLDLPLSLDSVGENMELLSIVQVMDFTSENHLSSRAVRVHCVGYREHIVSATSVPVEWRENELPVD